MSIRHATGTILAGLALATAAAAHIRLFTPAGSGLRWSNPANISFVIQADGSDDVPDGSHFSAIRAAARAWTELPGSNATLVEDTDPTQQARRDWFATDLHTVLFDESNQWGLFPAGTGVVALTPVVFQTGGSSDGVIVDADVVFNGQNITFSTVPSPADFDIQSIATHELGHFLGFDHSGVGGATMYPFVIEGAVVPRGPSVDDENAVQEVYKSAAFGTLRGVVRRQSDNSAVSGAHVVCRDATTGRSAGATLADATGSFWLRGLAAGDYTVVAHPLSGVVDSSNVAVSWTIATDFDATEHPTPVTVGGGTTVDMGDLLVSDPAGGVQLGNLGAGLPFVATAGQTSPVFLVTGTGLAPSSTFTASDPTVTLTNVTLSGTVAFFQVVVPSGAAPGLFDLAISNASGSAILPGAVEVVPDAPTVTGVVPSSGSAAGGTALTISGSGFRPGASVHLAKNVYRDGDPGVVVQGPGTISLTTAPSCGGTWDVVVVDPTGLEGRLGGAFSIMPIAASAFPTAGSTAGGTTVVVVGQGFVSGLTVQIDGVAQPGVTVSSATRLTFTTQPGLAGGPYVLRVTNPDGSFADSAFSYVAQADPQVASVSPQQGKAGTRVTLSGSDFSPNSEVVFGADPDTGQGGKLAGGFTFVDAQTLRVDAPSHAAGKVAVLVRDTVTGQAFVLNGAFTYKSSGGGGGGGCHTEIVSAPPDPGRALLQSAWLAVLLSILVWRHRRLRVVPVPSRQR